MKKLFLVAAMLTLASITAFSQEAAKSSGGQFLWVLRPTAALLDEKKEAENTEVLNRHFKRLVELQKQGKVVLGGRTTQIDANALGIIIIEAGSEAEARELMENDDAVKAKLMTAQLFPFKVILTKAGCGQ